MTNASISNPHQSDLYLEPLKPRQRRERRDVDSIVTGKHHIKLDPGQYFCETPKAWEIWQEIGEHFLPMMIKRIPRKTVCWIHKKESA